MGRAAKVTKVVEQALLDTIERIGDETKAYQRFNLSADVYYRFRKRSPEYCAKVEEAKRQFIELQKAELAAEITKARDDVWQYRLRCLRGEQFRTSLTVHRDLEGKVLYSVAKKEQVLPHEDWLKTFDLPTEEPEFTIRVEIAEPPEGFNTPQPGDEDL
jgi:hypothetical protein